MSIIDLCKRTTDLNETEEYILKLAVITRVNEQARSRNQKKYNQDEEQIFRDCLGIGAH